MFALLSHSIKDPSVLRRLEFAATFYPKSMPNYWESLSNFCLKGAKPDKNSLTASQVKQHVENMEVVDNGAFLSNLELTKEILTMPTKLGDSNNPLGVVLISNKVNCRNCGLNPKYSFVQSRYKMIGYYPNYLVWRNTMITLAVHMDSIILNILGWKGQLRVVQDYPITVSLAIQVDPTILDKMIRTGQSRTIPSCSGYPKILSIVGLTFIARLTVMG